MYPKYLGLDVQQHCTYENSVVFYCWLDFKVNILQQSALKE